MMPTVAGERGRAAFTLIEAMCTLAIVALMMSAVFGALTTTIRSVESVRERMRECRTVCGIARILRRDLAVAYGASENKIAPLEGGVTEGIAGGTCLSFFSANALLEHADKSTSGFYRIDYALRPSDRVHGRYEILRTETPYTVGRPLDTHPSVTERLADGVPLWRLGFYDGIEWHDRWRRKDIPTIMRLEMIESDAPAIPREVFYFSPLVTFGADPLPLERAPGSTHHEAGAR